MRERERERERRERRARKIFLSPIENKKKTAETGMVVNI